MHQLKLSKLILLMKVIAIYLLFVCVFSTKCLVTVTAQQNSNKLNENLFSTFNNRGKIVSLDLPDNSHQQSQNCSEPAILKFPWDGLTQEQRQNGWLIIHIMVMFYGFWFLASINDDYLVPSIQQICKDLDIDCTALGAAITAAAVASPSLFINCIDTFITTADIGIGTIVGSVTFNLLAVPACSGLFVAKYLKLDWRRLTTKDCLIPLKAILALVCILGDGRVWWYEALAMIFAYLGYILIMCYKASISRGVKRYLKRLGYYKPCYNEVNEFTGLLGSKYSSGTKAFKNLVSTLNSSHVMLFLEQQQKEDILLSPWSCQNQTFVEFFLRWPITFLLWLTVPNSRRRNSFKYLTLILSLVWTAVVSYITIFAAIVIGDTLNIPDSTMGLTLLAAGISIPKAVSSMIAARQGQAYMCLSNSLSSSTFEILICLAFPWLIKSYFLPEVDNQKVLQFNSLNLTYSYGGIMLLAALLVLYMLLVGNKFALNRRFGVSCLIMYTSFMITTILVELNLFFPFNFPKCRH